ncbi:putative cyclase [Paramyrothecium foliicola]|nr:putative cyclase [Paramyrothecium foliicola]
MANRRSPLPSLSELPLHEGDPPNSAWGLWGDLTTASLGSLNYLTDELVLQTTREEVQTGTRVGLDLPLDLFDPPLLGRSGLEQKVINKDPFVVNDDVITFNTQCSSQWDSLRHFAYQKEKTFYNGVTQDDVHAAPRTAVNGLQPWTEKGIVGRGVLIDYASYAEKKGLQVSHFGPHAIPLHDIVEIVKEQRLEFHIGDILLLRTGYAAAYKGLKKEEREKVAHIKEWCGLAQSRETTDWLWKNQFAAVASDSPGFEHTKAPTEKEWHLHPILLAGWGTPIGELFDLDRLAELCRQNDKWSFMFTSAPLNYTGAVASPPNAVAIL